MEDERRWERGCGTEWGWRFAGITNQDRAKPYRALDDEHPAIDCFRELGEGLIQTQLAKGELPTQVKELEKSVCQEYCKAGPATSSCIPSGYRASKCGCKLECKKHCSCFTAVCKCFGNNCTNPFKVDARVDDKEEDDGALRA